VNTASKAFAPNLPGNAMSQKPDIARFAVGIMIGIIVGILVGLYRNNPGLGIAIGLPLGIGIGFVFSNIRK